MLVIVCSSWDESAKALASRWDGEEVAILTPRDLSRRGWRQGLGSEKSGVAVIDGKPVANREITGVLTRLPCVYAQELVHIVPEDRAYIASEMTAFLRFWLARLECPVLNRPTPMCLAGPYWRQEKWVQVAAAAGIPVRPVRRVAGATVVAPEELERRDEVTLAVVGSRILGEADARVCRAAQRLASLAEVELLAVHFSGSDRDAEFIGAEIFPDLSDNTLASAVLDVLHGAPVACN